MPKRTLQIPSIQEVNFLRSVSQTIDFYHLNILRNANESLVVTFWETGKIIKNNIETGNQMDITKIANRLVQQFGPFFSENNLSKMVALVELFPNRMEFGKLAAIISWNHLVVILDTKDQQACFYYCKLMITDNLSPDDLQKAIADKKYEQSRAGKRAGNTIMNAGFIYGITANFTPILKMGIGKLLSQEWLIDNVFAEPTGSFFRAMMEPVDIGGDMEEMNDQEWESVQSIVKLINDFSRQRTRQFNDSLNRMFLEVGKRINQEFLSLSNKERIHESEDMLKSLYGSLTKKFGNSYNKKNLLSMMEIQKEMEINNPDLFIESEISWKHFPLILALEDHQQKQFYAHLVAYFGLTVSGLRRQIRQKLYEKTQDPIQRKKNKALSAKVPIIETDITREEKGNNSFISTIISIKYTGKNAYRDRDKFRNAGSLFDNPYCKVLASIVPGK